VSQHIKALEDLLDIKLFDRISQKLIPTSAGTELYQQCARSFKELEGQLERIKKNPSELSGVVSVGMPIEFGNNVLVPLISEFCKKHPFVRVKLTLDFASVMNDLLLNGKVDFAFVDQYQMDRRIDTEQVAEEIVDLCISESLMTELTGNPQPPAKLNRKYYEALPYVDYQEGEPLLRMWMHHHIGTRGTNLQVRATVMDVQSIARLIVNGVGAGILPDHLLIKLIGEGHKIFKFKGCGKPLKNAISVAFLGDRTLSRPATELFLRLKSALG